MQKFYLRTLPYFISVIVGIIIFLTVDYVSTKNWQDLAINVSAGLISVPLIFICYELIRDISEKKIRTKIRNYINFHTEKNTFAFLKYFYNWFFPTQKSQLIMNENKVQQLIDLTPNDIEQILTEKTLLGFFIYKDISENISNLNSIIKNQNLNNYLTDREMIHFMDILRNITLIKREILDFIPIGKNKNLKIKSDNNPINQELELFYKNTKIDASIFNNIEKAKLLEYFKVPTESIELISNQISNLLNDIKDLIMIMEIDFWKEEAPYGIKSPNY